MKIFEFAQKSPEWWHIRRGIPTASQFYRILTPKKGTPSASQGPYIDSLIDEQLNPQWSVEDSDSYVSPDMQNGINNEPQARNWYGTFGPGEEVRQVGFCLSDCGRFGCSPDGLVGEDGALEIKCPSQQVHEKYLRLNRLPPEYKCQVHGTLIVTRRKWIDFLSYSPVDDVNCLLIRVFPDAFTELLEKELNKFHLKYLAAWAKMGRPLDRPVDHMVPSFEA